MVTGHPELRRTALSAWLVCVLLTRLFPALRWKDLTAGTYPAAPNITSNVPAEYVTGTQDPSPC